MRKRFAQISILMSIMAAFGTVTRNSIASSEIIGRMQREYVPESMGFCWKTTRPSDGCGTDESGGACGESTSFGLGNSRTSKRICREDVGSVLRANFYVSFEILLDEALIDAVPEFYLKRKTFTCGRMPFHEMEKDGAAGSKGHPLHYSGGTGISVDSNCCTDDEADS